MRDILGIGGISIASLTDMMNTPVISFGPNPTQPRVRRNSGMPHFDPRINRNTGRPHEHKREIARRLRQSA